MHGKYPRREPFYIQTGTDRLTEKAEKAALLREKGVCCPRRCGADRSRGGIGDCGAADKVLISSYGGHFGEESVLVGRGGSGTIFFTHCNLSCVFCQNWSISQGAEQGETVTSGRLADIMLYLQESGSENINLVTPTPYVPAIIRALAEAAGRGLRLPVVYNCGGYEDKEVLRLLAGVVDIYMPDCKYGDSATAFRLSGVKNYFERMKEALQEMQKQTGDLQIDPGTKTAWRGVLVRHLVLPEGLAGTEKVMKFLAEDISPNCAVNVMAQYYPAYKAMGHPPLDRRVTRQEVNRAVRTAADWGLRLID